VSLLLPSLAARDEHFVPRKVGTHVLPFQNLFESAKSALNGLARIDDNATGNFRPAFSIVTVTHGVPPWKKKKPPISDLGPH
jgi:hypothetical protein